MLKLPARKSFVEKKGSKPIRRGRRSITIGLSIEVIIYILTFSKPARRRRDVKKLQTFNLLQLHRRADTNIKRQIDDDLELAPRHLLHTIVID